MFQEAEHFSSIEIAILKQYFTNTNQPVFALINLPEVVKGALFARYSRSNSSLRRLFLDEFYQDLDLAEHQNMNSKVGLQRAEQLYDKVFIEYGDDSVAQLGGVHLACEQVSNLLTKVLEWGRLMSYLEQSTRYINYDSTLNGRYRYYRDPDVTTSEHGGYYVYVLDQMFAAYSQLVPQMQTFVRANTPKPVGGSDFAYRNAVKAKALDALRGLLPAASLSNLGMYGSGQAYENLLIRMRSHPLPEARLYSDMMLTELRKLIPSFLKRVDLDDRGNLTSKYLSDNHEAMKEASVALFPVLVHENREQETVRLVDYDPDGEIKTVAAILYPYTSASEETISRKVRAMSVTERLQLIRDYCGDRSNRRHRPGRAFERTCYRFDVLSDYGAFRDLQRHRMMTIEWQPLSVAHGYHCPDIVDQADIRERYDLTMNRSAQLYERLLPEFPEQARYAVALGYRIRYSIQMNARQAMHMIELRTTPQGHPVYREVCQQMHKLIAEQAGHTAIAEAMKFVERDNSGETQSLGRLEAEQRTADLAEPQS